MDQLKDIMKQAVKYRFWIAGAISVLLPMIGYFVGSGPINAKEKEARDQNTIDTATEFNREI